MLVIMEFMVFFFFFNAGLKEVNADMLRSCKKGDRKGVAVVLA